MWCYQKPGFEALVLAELQRQQQCSQFCDTLLKTEGISVPAHSCILSAISPHISSALSSMPPPPAGQAHLLEFQALGACTLLHMVRLLYCGEMAGQGEKERQEAISAAAKLGIHGLVEVTRRDRKSRNEDGEGLHMEVGVQTEPPMPEENGGRPGRWRREVTDGGTFLWKETLSDGKNDTCTQTEEQKAQADLPSHPAASFETIDMATLQSLGQTDSQLLPPEIPYIPMSLIYPPGENQTHQPSSAVMDSTAAGHTSVVAPPYTFAPPPLLPFSSQATPCAADWWAGTQGAPRGVAAEWEGERLEEFQDNIPGYISYFLNQDKEEGFHRGRARSRRGAGVGGARRAGTGDRRARRPRARAGGRGRGGLTQMVDVQEVGVSKLQKLFMQRWRPSRTGQGGGAVGRKLYLNTRELLMSAKSCQRRRGRAKAWQFSQKGDVLPYSEGEGGGGNTRRGRKSTTQQFNQDGLPVGRAPRARAKPTTSVSFPSPNMPFYNIQTLSAFSPSLHPSPSPAASYVPPASSLVHSTSLPPPAPPPHQEQPEHIDRLLEAVMMGLDILPNSGAPHSQPPLPSSSNSCAYTSSVNTLAQNKQRGSTTGFLEASPGFHGPTRVAEMPVLQQQGEEELTEMLDHFLQSFEQHVDNCTSREEVEKGGQSFTEAAQSKYRNPPHLQNTHTPRPARRPELQQRDEAETPPRHSQLRKASACSAAPPRHTEGSPGKVSPPAKRRKRRRKNEYLFSLEKKMVKVREPGSSSDAKAKFVHDRRDEQLQQIPVVKLRRSGPLPARVTLQDPSCLEVKSSAKPKTSSSSAKRPHDSLGTKTYPIRSRFREAQIMDSVPFLEKPLQIKRPTLASRPHRSLLSLSNGESSAPPIHPVEPCGMEEQREKNQESLGSTGSWEEAHDEDIDVMGGSSPAPDPVIICWTESSEGEEEEGVEDIDVVGEMTEYASSAIFATLSTGELSRKYQTEVLLH